MERLGLRIRVFLFFGLLAGGSIVILAGAIALVVSRADPPLSTAPFVTAAIVFALLNTGLLAGVWLLFDENVAKPINRLSANLRTRAHAGVDRDLDAADARYLGDLAPAAIALSEQAATSVEDTAARIAQETERLGAEHSRLAALLTESPIATVLLNPAQEIVLYDAQAAAILSEIAVPRLKAPLADYFEMTSLNSAVAALDAAGSDVSFTFHPRGSGAPLGARVKALGADGHIIFIDPPAGTADHVGQRPLVFDFDLMAPERTSMIHDTPLSEICFVILDLETTGLSVSADDIIQIGAVRALNGVIVPGEEISTFVNPGRPIPPASTRVHRITDDHVRDAPVVSVAMQSLCQFAHDAVLVAHNAPFDIGLLKRHSQGTDAVWDHPVLDTVLLSAVAFGTTEEHSLDSLCDRLSIEIAPEERHTAIGDARATAEALIKLIGVIESKGLTTFGELEPELNRQARRLYTNANA